MESKFFSEEGRECFNRLMKHFNKIFFRYMVESVQQGDYLGLDLEFEQKLARVTFEKLDKNFLEKEDVISCLFALLKEYLTMIFLEIESERAIEYPLTSLFDGYYINQDQADTVARCVKTFSGIRVHGDVIPTELFSVIENPIPLVGTDKSPLEKQELCALQRYLGSKRNIYVHILLGSLYEMNRHGELFNKNINTEQDIMTICNSTWLFLLSFHYLQG